MYQLSLPRRFCICFPIPSMIKYKPNFEPAWEVVRGNLDANVHAFEIRICSWYHHRVLKQRKAVSSHREGYMFPSCGGSRGYRCSSFRELSESSHMSSLQFSVSHFFPINFLILHKIYKLMTQLTFSFSLMQNQI